VVCTSADFATPGCMQRQSLPTNQYTKLITDLLLLLPLLL
jgi:hypothetical protein